LHAPAVLMRAVTAARNSLYDRGWMPSRRLDLPIVSVGNLSVGGTGKTPMVVWLARALIERDRRPGLLSRGYRAKEGALNDEGRLLERLLPGVPQVQQPDRVSGALELESRGADVVLLDDGFQHRRLERDLDFVLIDATRPWGLPSEDGRDPVCALLPRGLLREGLASLGRASAIVITRSDAVTPAQLRDLDERLEFVAPGIPRLLARHRALGVRSEEKLEPLESLRGRPVRLVSGIGNPTAFERTARDAGVEVRGVHVFPDHHAFRAEELEQLEGEDEFLVTAKDSVKLEALGVPHLVLEVEFDVVRGLAVLNALLDALPESRASRERAALHEGLHG